VGDAPRARVRGFRADGLIQPGHRASVGHTRGRTQITRSGVSRRPAGSLDDGVQAGMRAPAGSAVQARPQVRVQVLSDLACRFLLRSSCRRSRLI
jgi:hypothetical protein